MPWIDWVLPLLFLLIAVCALWKRLPAYDLFCQGCKDGLKTAITVLPNLIAMMVGLAFLSASGLMTALSQACAPVFSLLGLPAEVAPLALLRPLSGSASLGMVQQLMETYGADSRIGLIACTLMGSSETIFYTVCIYLGSIRVKRTGYSIPCALLGALAGLIVSGLFFR